MATSYQPPAFQPPPRRKTSPAVIILLVILGVGVLLFAGCAALLVSGAKEVAKNPEVNAPKKVAAFNAPAKDGQFTFRVTKVKRTGHVGDSVTGSDAQGEYIVVSVTVFNHGRKAQMLDASSQKLIAGGATYDADSGAFTDSRAFVNNINPGNSVAANLAFDVPKGTQADQVVLHDSPFSNGVRVALK
jgi:hypothetical protein